MDAIPYFWPWAVEAGPGGWASTMGFAHVHNVTFFFSIQFNLDNSNNVQIVSNL
jgi:hypothetical protein